MAQSISALIHEVFQTSSMNCLGIIDAFYKKQQCESYIAVCGPDQGNSPLYQCKYVNYTLNPDVS